MLPIILTLIQDQKFGVQENKAFFFFKTVKSKSHSVLAPPAVLEG